MDFSIAIDSAACANVPDLDPSHSMVRLTENDLEVYFGKAFELHASRSDVASAQPMADPRPTTFLTMGVSSAVNTLGHYAVSVIGTHDGLVQIEFREPIAARVVGDPAGADQEPVGADIPVRQLIVSLEDPGEFLAALSGRSLGESEGEPEAAVWPTGG